MQTTFPAGLVDDNVEFFADHNLQLFKLKDGKRIPFEDFDKTTLDLCVHYFAQSPAKAIELSLMGINDPVEQLKQFMICNYGGFDNEPDLIDGVLQPTEYWACPHRGSCAHEGKLCDSLRTDTGEYITKTEIRVLKLVALSKLDKEIADEMGISVNTVPVHTRNLRRKTGLDRKADLTRFALQKNLI